MKKGIMVVVTLALSAISGCYSNSGKGGSVIDDEGFKIAVRTFSTEVQQGETKNVIVSIERDQYFKQDVKLQIKASPGIKVAPTNAMVKASDTPDVQLQISAAKDAAIGAYKVSVKATPETGKSTSTEFDVSVVAP